MRKVNHVNSLWKTKRKSFTDDFQGHHLANENMRMENLLKSETIIGVCSAIIVEFDVI